ncbi:MAG TPA: ATP-binding protein [Opitutaceae bacterium]|nr:ATP-binding protein [Opitutaceae bacterium]
MPDSDLPPSEPGPSRPFTADDYMRLFNLALDLLCIAGLDGYFKKVNPSWTRVMGWSEAELLSRPVADFMHPEDRERTLAARADLAKGIELRGLANRYVCKDGSYRWLEWQSAVEVSDGTVFAVARDITEQRQLEQERLILSKLESTGILAGGIAHDFNNLLGGVLLNLDMVALIGSITDEQLEHLRRARESVRSAEALTHQLLTFAEGGDAARKRCAVEPLLRQSVHLALSGSAIRAKFEIAADTPAIEVDENQLSQVIRNVALNARDAMPGGGMLRVRTAKVRRAGNPAGESVRITISDEGFGITPESLPKIFDPYFSTKPRGAQKGMGLGLTISRSILQKHGGSISIESAPSAGTTVTIELPAAPKPVDPPRPATVPPLAPGPSTTKILVMDDEPVFRQIVGEAIRLYGYRVELAANGDEVLASCDTAAKSGNPFDIVLLDLTVRGGKGGAETMRLLRDRYPKLKGVLMTGYSGEQIFREYARHGFSAALGKPFSADALDEALRHVLLAGTDR